MADEIQHISDYRDAIEGLLLNGEELEAAFPLTSKLSVDSGDPQVIALTSQRLLICHRFVRRGSFEDWLPSGTFLARDPIVRRCWVGQREIPRGGESQEMSVDGPLGMTMDVAGRPETAPVGCPYNASLKA